MTAVRKLIIADDYIVLREELRAILEGISSYHVVGQAGDGLEVLSLLEQGSAPDALILDLMMPRMAGLDTLTEIRRIGYSFPVLVLTMHKEPELLCRTFFAGATGYMLKDGIAQELVNALNTVLERKVYLSPSIKRELPVTCRLSPHTGQQLPSNFGHCSQSKFC